MRDWYLLFSFLAIAALAMEVHAAHVQKIYRFSNVIFDSCQSTTICTFFVGDVTGNSKNEVSVRLHGIFAPKQDGACEKERDLAKKMMDYLHTALESANDIDLRNARKDEFAGPNDLVADVIADDKNLSTEVLKQNFAVPLHSSLNHSWCIEPSEAATPKPTIQETQGNEEHWNEHDFYSDSFQFH